MIFTRSKLKVLPPLENAQRSIHTLLGAGSQFEGKLVFAGSVRIDGQFRGELIHGACLVIGEGASIEARIEVEQLIVYGQVHGEIFAVHTVTIYPPAVVVGSITTPELIIHKGVRFTGQSHMPMDDLAPPLIGTGSNTEQVADPIATATRYASSNF